jgi:hypothetical protein
MEVGLHANKCDQSTKKIADALRQPFKLIGPALKGDYGGTIEHLWIDFELIRSHSEMSPPWSFRFQKKVGGGRCPLTGLDTPIYRNVGHYGVHPDFDTLLSLEPDSVVPYVLSLIYDSTEVLIEKQKKLGGFNADAFRSTFWTACYEAGFNLTPKQI